MFSLMPTGVVCTAKEATEEQGTSIPLGSREKK
jgi:hypothetical protein